jgi:hypothetical protein
MGTFPNFSNIADYAQRKLESRVDKPYAISKLNAWVRITSAASSKVAEGLTIVANPNFKLFGAAGVSSIYGNDKQSGTIGESWGGKAINTSTGQGYRPSPTIESIEVNEGAGSLSRKASFSVKCFSLEQLELASKYFQEPGFTIFLEWGWNTPDSMKGFKATKNLSANTIAKFQNFDEINNLRKASGGEYDNYLGYITGGGIKSDSDTWTIEVNCTGFTELPSYLVNGDNAGKKTETAEGKKLSGITPKESDYKNLGLESDLNVKRWMFAYNALPSNRKTPAIKSLESGEDSSLRKVKMAHAVNYVNFDETIVDTLNRKADGSWLGRNTWFGSEGVEEGGKTAGLPAGTMLIGKEKFIRFGALIKIINQMSMAGYKIGNKTVSTQIRSDFCVCGAYKNIFSTNKGRLMIPNPNTPNFSLQEARSNVKAITEIPNGAENLIDCTIEHKSIKIQFPFEGNIENSKVTVNGTSHNISYSPNKEKTESIVKTQGNWGFLDDLYVNFDFASGILETSNFVVKDALYQILNGMSSAVNDLWDFQVMETQLEEDKTENGVVLKKGDSILSIKETNFTYTTTSDPYKFNLIGTKSIFKDASLSMDMSGAKMNQVIGTRISTKINENTQPNMGQLFATDMTDLVLKSINSNKENTTNDQTPPIEEETDEELKEKNYLNFLGKLGTYPKVSVIKKEIPDDFELDDFTYKCVFDDKSLLKLGKQTQENTTSILLPINFTFTIHGISGIKRGDKFSVSGIPKKYENQGFFQVTSVKHSIQGMEWTTEVTGGYRNQKF